jgi:hypothetical protein
MGIGDKVGQMAGQIQDGVKTSSISMVSISIKVITAFFIGLTSCADRPRGHSIWDNWFCFYDGCRDGACLSSDCKMGPCFNSDI